MKVIALLATLAVLIGIILWQQNQIRQLKLQAIATQSTVLPLASGELNHEQPRSNSAAVLTQDQYHELLRLRGEVGTLKRDLAVAINQASTSQAQQQRWVQQASAAQSFPDPGHTSGVFPGQSDRPLTVSNNLPREEERPGSAFSDWPRIKISDSGQIFVNKRQVSLADFATECHRIKQAGLGAVIYIDSPNRPQNAAQKEAFNKLIEAGVGMKLVLQESALD